MQSALLDNAQFRYTNNYQIATTAVILIIAIAGSFVCFLGLHTIIRGGSVPNWTRVYFGALFLNDSVVMMEKVYGLTRNLMAGGYRSGMRACHIDFAFAVFPFAFTGWSLLFLGLTRYLSVTRESFVATPTVSVVTIMLIVVLSALTTAPPFFTNSAPDSIMIQDGFFGCGPNYRSKEPTAHGIILFYVVLAFSVVVCSIVIYIGVYLHFHKKITRLKAIAKLNAGSSKKRASETGYSARLSARSNQSIHSDVYDPSKAAVQAIEKNLTRAEVDIALICISIVCLFLVCATPMFFTWVLALCRVPLPNWIDSIWGIFFFLYFLTEPLLLLYFTRTQLKPV
ncbi:hypothetical protein HDV03_000573 [Kappamyces sp. JEL0829]|nr:hypothetical protein HDV03_000573 [Kappamyces sp. JEL0829]